MDFVLSPSDIAVGAPYEDGGAGKVYIYHGSAQGINTSPAQVGFIDLYHPEATFHRTRDTFLLTYLGLGASSNWK